MATAPLGHKDSLEETDVLRERFAHAEAVISEMCAASAKSADEIEELRASQAELLKRNQALQLRAEELQTLLDTLPLGIFIADDPDCFSITGNKTLQEILQVSANQNVSQTAPTQERPTNYRTFCNGVEVPGENLPAQRAARDAVSCLDEIEIRFEDGTKKDVLVFAAPLFNANGKPRGSVGGLLDITERKQMEDRLRLMNERFQVALKGSNIMVFNQDLQLKYTWVHDPVLGANTEQFLGKRDTEIFQRLDDASKTETIKRRVIETGVSEHQEVCVEVDGAERYYDLRVDPTFAADGTINGITCAAIDVTDRKLIETSLKDSDRRKNEFLATLAHELRNPLAPLRNGLQLMEMAGDNAEKMLDVRTMMDRQLSQLVRLVDDLLDLSRISQGKISLELKPTRLKDVIQSAIETSEPLIDEMGHLITVTFPDDSVHVNADFTRLSQVLVNLINNAAKYSEKNSYIELVSKVIDQQVVVEVIDTGIGISREGLACAFDMFAQVDDSIKRSQGGLGIGLSLVKRLVEIHGGRVEAHSDGIGCGSRFSVQLPIASVVAANEAIIKVAPPRLSFNILVVDDNKDSANSLAIVLKASGHSVHTAYDGEQALAAYRELSPQIILLDIGLPKADGHSVCRSIREAGDKNVIVIAQSGWGQDQDRKLSDQAGFDDHLVKPVNLRSLLDVMNKLWTSRQ